MSYILYQLKCCCGPRGCSSLCIGPVRESSTTRLMYSVMLILVSFILIISHENQPIKWAAKEFNSTFNSTCMYLRAESNCHRLSGYKAIYRIAFAFCCFHLSMALLCLYINNSQGWRARIHNGFWFLKFLFITSLWLSVYLIPIFEEFMYAATLIGVIGAILFVIVQHVSLIDCAYEFNGYLRERCSKNCIFLPLLYTIAGFLYACTVGAYVFIYICFAVPSYCLKNRIVIIVNVTVSVILVTVSFFLGIHHQNKLYIPGGVVSVFVSFLTWTAISSSPDVLIPIKDGGNVKFDIPYDENKGILLCRPKDMLLRSHLSKELHIYIGLVLMLITAVYSSIKSTVDYQRYGIKPAKSKILSQPQLNVTTEDVEMEKLKKKSKHRISGSHMVTSFGDLSTINRKFVSMPNVTETHVKKKMELKKTKKNRKSQNNLSSSNSNVYKRQLVRRRTMSQSRIDKRKSKDHLPDLGDIPEEPPSCPMDQYLIHDEYFVVRYSYSWLHLVFGLSYLFVMVQLTNWYSPETSHLLKFEGTDPSMWMKIATSWVALALYGWSLLVPQFCIGRKLYENPMDSMKRYTKTITQSRVSSC